MYDFENLSALTKEDLLSSELVDQIFDEQDPVERESLIGKIEGRAAELRVKAPFQKMVKAAQKQIEAELKQQADRKRLAQKEAARNQTATLTIGDESTAVNTGRWVVDMKNGVYTYGMIGEIVACRYPIYVTQKFENLSTGKERIEVTWLKDGRRKSTILDRADAASQQKIVGRADVGLPVDSVTAKHLVSFLADFERLNSNLIPLKTSVNKLGWIEGQNTFVPYTDDISFDDESGFKEIVTAVTTHGSKDIWLNTVRQIRAARRPELAIYLAASYGSILLGRLGMLPFIVNLYGGSGVGKTVALMYAISVWADPGGSKYMSESTSTQTSLELRLNCLNDLPLAVDDMSKLKSGRPSDFTSFIYTLCSGRGKGRATKTLGSRTTASWSNAVLTNMERPLVDESMQGGAINRVLDIAIDGGKFFKDGNYIANTFRKHYGYSGKEFVELVTQIGTDKIEELRDEYADRIRESATAAGQEKEAKQVAPMALILAVDELIEEYIFKDGIRLDLDFCVSQLKNVTEVSEMERAYQHFKDTVIQHWNNFMPISEDGAYKGDIWGGQTSDGSVAVLPTRFDQIALENNYSPKQFVSWLEKTGRLVKDSDGVHKQKRVRIPILDKSPRCWVIRMIDSDELDDID